MLTCVKELDLYAERDLTWHAILSVVNADQCVQLPDGNEIQIGPERFGVPELLFQPVGSPVPKLADSADWGLSLCLLGALHVVC